MAIRSFKDARVWVDGFDLSGQLNQVSLDYSAEVLDATVLTSQNRVKVAGFKQVSFASQGYWAADEAPNPQQIDKTLYERIGQLGSAVSIGPLTGADGEVAYTFRSVFTRYQPGAAVGELLAFSVEAQGETALVRGTILHNATKTSTGSGTGRQLGSVSSSQKLHATLHVLSVSGTSPSLTVRVQSDDNSGFSSASDRITFNAATAIGAQIATPVAGPITDDWWRVDFTISGTSPSFTFVVVVGIQ